MKKVHEETYLTSTNAFVFNNLVLVYHKRCVCCGKISSNSATDEALNSISGSNPPNQNVELILSPIGEDVESIDEILLHSEGSEYCQWIRDSLPNIPGLIFHKIEKDGECHGAMKAISFCCNIDCIELRNNIVEYVRNQSNRGDNTLSDIIESFQSLDDFYEHFCNTEQLDILEIELAKRILERRIIIIQSNGKARNNRIFQQYQHSTPIFLYYNGYNHYDAFSIITEDISIDDIFEKLL